MTLLDDDKGGGGEKGAGGTGSGGSGGAGGAGGTGGEKSWRDTLPDDLKNDAGLSTFTDVAALAKSYLSTKAHVGKKGIIPPGEKASDDEVKAFHKALGLPDLEKYEVSPPKDKKVQDEIVKGFKEIAHKSGILPKQAQAVLEWFIGAEESAAQVQAKAKETSTNEKIADLKKELGAGYDKELSKARLAAKEAGSEFQEYLRDSGLGNDPMVIKALAKYGALYGEDKLRGEGGGKFGQTPAEIQAKIDRVMGDAKHPYFDAHHAGHATAVKEMEALFQSLPG